MLVEVFKGGSFIKNSSKPPAKIITFDLDETLGDFGDLCFIWHIIESHIPIFMTKIEVFQKLIELFPECIRPGIPSILEYLYQKKRGGLCSHVFLYTNNQRSREWVELVLEYFELKIPGLFDQVICAFKIHDQRIEPMRTTHSKTYSDLIRCTLLPKNAQICFVDNTYHPKMIHERVYYIQPRSYQHRLSREEIVRRISKWAIFPIPLDKIINAFLDKKGIENCLWKSNSTRNSLAVSQKIMYHLKEYFLLSTKQPKTKKIVWTLGRFTRKKRS